MLVRRLLVVAVVLAALASGGARLQAQTPDCPPEQPPNSGAMRVTIGYFADSAEEVGEFCRYLARNNIRPRLRDLGSVNDAAAVRNARALLKSEEIDVFWVNTSAVAVLAANAPDLLKVIAVSDSLVVHVAGRPPSPPLVTDGTFAPARVLVVHGRSEFYVDKLFVALGQGLRCLPPPRPECKTSSKNTLPGDADTFFRENPSGVLIIVARMPDPLVLSLLQPPLRYRLIGIPSNIVVQMESVRGALVPVVIPHGGYGLRRMDANVPGEDVLTAGAAMFLVSWTPAPVAARVAEFTVRINTILLTAQPRVAREDVRRALDMVREMSQQFPGRIALHPAYAQQLAQQNLLPPEVPVAAPTPSTPFPAPPAPSPPTPVPPPGAPSGGVEIRAFFARPTALTSGQRGQLCWQMRNANEASIVPEIGPLNPGELAAGCREIAPARTTTYVLLARGPDGRTVQQRATVVVAPPQIIR